MNGGWPSDQQISFSPLLNQDGVEVAGHLDDWRADMLGGKTPGLREPHTDCPKLQLKQPKPLCNVLKLTSGADSNLSDKVQAACRTLLFFFFFLFL